MQSDQSWQDSLWVVRSVCASMQSDQSWQDTLWVVRSVSASMQSGQSWQDTLWIVSFFVLFEVLRPSQPNGVMLSAVSLPNHTFTG